MSALQHVSIPARCTRATATTSATPPSSRSSTETTTVLDLRDQEIKTSPASPDDSMSNIDEYDDDYDEDNISHGEEAKKETEDEDFDGGVKLKPFDTDKTSTYDKRKFGGSSKGRKCFRWTRTQENAAVQDMLKIRAEGDILGHACFDELHKRLVAEHGSEWNHSVSGIHNAWHRRDLVTRVRRAEARAEKQKRLKEDMEDEEIGLNPMSKRGRKRRSSNKLTFRTKRKRSANDTDENVDDQELVVSSKCRPVDKKASISGHVSLLSINTSDPTSSHALTSGSLFTPPATMSSPTILYFPTVTIAFKRHNNDSRRNREFADIDTMHKFWNQVVAAPCFNNLENAFRVVSVLVNGKKALNMAQHDKLDYSSFVDRIERAVDGAGGGEVLVVIKAVF